MFTSLSLVLFVLAAALLCVVAVRTKRRFTVPLSAVVSLAVFAVVFLVSKHLGLAGLTAAPFIFGTVQGDADVVRQLVSWGIFDACIGFKKPIPVAKTANYQLVSPQTSAGDASGTIFTTRGAGGAVTFTLPAITPYLAGVVYEFLGVANQNIGVAAAAGTVVTFNNVAATSVTASTAGGKIGAHFRAICDGTSWHVIGDTAGVTYTVA